MMLAKGLILDLVLVAFALALLYSGVGWLFSRAVRLFSR